MDGQAQLDVGDEDVSDEDVSDEDVSDEDVNTKRKPYACALTSYSAGFYSVIQSRNETTQKSNAYFCLNCG